jgi:hypothetical protein
MNELVTPSFLSPSLAVQACDLDLNQDNPSFPGVFTDNRICRLMKKGSWASLSESGLCTGALPLSYEQDLNLIAGLD